MYNLWQTVCRKVEMGESSTTAIIREIDEETRIKLNKGLTIRKEPLQPILIKAPFHRVGLDIKGLLPVTKDENRYIIVTMDYFTKWPEARAIKDIKAKTVAKFLYEESVSINNKAIDDALLDRLIILIDKLELNKQYALDNMNQSQERQKDRYNNHRVSERLKIGLYYIHDIVGFNYYKLRSIEERIVKGTIHAITPTTITLPPLLMISSQDARKIIDTEYMTQKDSKLSKHYFIISKRVFLIFEDNLEQLMRTQYMTTALF
ncbi:6823_t:CDS:2, partial [Funneliformis geosporum]